MNYSIIYDRYYVSSAWVVCIFHGKPFCGVPPTINLYTATIYTHFDFCRILWSSKLFPTTPSLVPRHPAGVVFLGRIGVPVPKAVCRQVAAPLVRSGFPTGSPPPMSLQNHSNSKKGRQRRKSYIWIARSIKIEFSPRRELIFHKFS